MSTQVRDSLHNTTEARGQIRARQDLSRGWEWLWALPAAAERDFGAGEPSEARINILTVLCCRGDKTKL